MMHEPKAKRQSNMTCDNATIINPFQDSDDNDPAHLFTGSPTVGRFISRSRSQHIWKSINDYGNHTKSRSSYFIMYAP